ncbi:MAG: LEA type 2 family protein [Bacteroidetes bacterium]|nr:LEA type 2 family protein [Bacteroidota bacterium]MBS1930060.1 LEA type 2 family protein [Bacteroidota bacterium]
MKKFIRLNPHFRIWLTGILFFSLFSCKAIKDPVFKGIDDLQVSGIGLKESIISIHLNYFNPNRSGLQLKNAEGDAWMDEQMLGHFTMDTSIKIPGHSDFTVPVKLNVNMKNAMKNVTTLLFKPEVNFKIEGKARIGKGGVFIHYPIRYEGKQDVSKLFH